jgi:hypothetical protein
MRQKWISKAASGLALAGFVGAAAHAANPEPVMVEVEFVEPITITEMNALQFGLVDTNIATGDIVTIATDGTVTADTGSRLLGGLQNAAALTVTATAGAAINILVDNVSSAAGYTLGGFQCEYNGVITGACEGAGLTTSAAGTAPLTIGATLTGVTGAPVGSANGSFDVTVAYP